MILLCVVIMISALPTIPQTFASASEKVGDKLENMTSQRGYIPNQASNCSCKVFADSVSKKLFGTTTGSLTSIPYKISTSDYTCVGTLTGLGATHGQLVKLLKKARPGDVVQYKSSYTNPYHTAVIYSVSDEALTLYNSRTENGIYKVKLDRMSWNSLSSSWPGIGSISGGTRGLSLYHSKKYESIYGSDDISTHKSNVKTVTIGVGETVNLKSVLNCDGDVVCTKKSVVAVSADGKATGKKAGTAAVTVNCSNGAKVICNVKVKAAPSSVKLNKKSVTLKVGQTCTLSSTVNSGTASLKRNYTTSDSSVVSLKGRVITAKKAGTAVITVKTFNGKTATCKVTVKK